jgi:hypothetical protein
VNHLLGSCGTVRARRCLARSRRRARGIHLLGIGRSLSGRNCRGGGRRWNRVGPRLASAGKSQRANEERGAIVSSAFHNSSTTTPSRMAISPGRLTCMPPVSR